MRIGPASSRLWGLSVAVVVHGLLLLAIMYGLEQPRTPSPDPGGVLTVALVTPPKPAPAQAGDAEPVEASEETPDSAADAVREEVHYHYPHELDRQLIVLRDQSADAEIDLPTEVVMHLFVDVQGRVVAITFEGEAPAPALQDMLRRAFMTMEFVPGLKQGRAVPSRIKIGIAPLMMAPAPATPNEVR